MQLPGPVRAVVGLFAAAAGEAKQLPERAIELPMLAVSSALQMSLRAQQRYARLAARGDDVINRRQASEEAPAWATFDDPVSPEELHAATVADPDPALRARAASQLLDQLLGMSEEPTVGTDGAGGKASADSGTEDADVVDFPSPAAAAARRGPVKAAAPARAAKKTGARAPAAAAETAAGTSTATSPAGKSPAGKSAVGKSAAPRKSARAEERGATKAATKKSTAKKTAARPGKTISRPRHGEPSAFDTVDDD